VLCCLTGVPALQMPEDLDKVKEEVDKRTVQAAPFPFDSKMEDVSQLFSQWGTVRQVRLLRYESAAVFSGRVFVEMATQAEADAVLKEAIEHHGVQLRLQSKPAYQAAVDEVRPLVSIGSHSTVRGRSSVRPC
jgi:RNA recognition motif. (a.k.a. RRM, RBD, or RNP domain)